MHEHALAGGATRARRGTRTTCAASCTDRPALERAAAPSSGNPLNGHQCFAAKVGARPERLGDLGLMVREHVDRERLALRHRGGELGREPATSRSGGSSETWHIALTVWPTRRRWVGW